MSSLPPVVWCAGCSWREDAQPLSAERFTADAALIVRAVNRDHLFDELVAALDALLSFSSEQAGAWEARASARALLARVKP